MKKARFNSLSAKISIIILAFVFVSTVAVGLVSYILFSGEAVQSNGEKALAISQAVAAHLDGDKVKAEIAGGERGEYYQSVKVYLDKVYDNVGMKYLYVMDSNYGSEAHYFASGAEPGDESAELGETDSLDAFADDMYESIRTGEQAVTGFYDSGEYGFLISGFTPVKDSSGAVVCVVGVDFMVNDVTNDTNMFGLLIIVMILAALVLATIFVLWYVKRFIGKPILSISNAAKQLAVGDNNISISVKSKDEVGVLADCFKSIVESNKKQAETLSTFASGDFTSDIEIRSEKDSTNLSLREMSDSLNRAFIEFYNSAAAVSNGAAESASQAQNLANGCTQQASAIEQLSSAVVQIHQKTIENSEKSKVASALTGETINNAQNGSRKMNEMVEAITEISKASQAINQVMKTIDEIAFQTNILALNASVEAARAGQHGKGFAVVADEVRSLAGKSSEAAKETEALISSALLKVDEGVSIAEQTSDALVEIVEGIAKANDIVKDIASASEEQSISINQLNLGIDQIGQVIQINSATSEEAAAGSESMNSQADNLLGLVSQFKLKSE